MRAVIPTALAAAIGLSACATPVEPKPGGPVTGANGDDCAVIAAVMTQHYRFNTTDNRPPPLWLDDRETGWAPRCDWSRYGLSFRTYDPKRQPAPGERIQWVSFKQPTYDGRGAMVETGIMHGPLAGMGHECRVISGFAGWTLGECTATWIS